ncbi:MAG: hydrogen peroxide-inducible genes activator [Hydrogenophilus sp.]|nr:hydrogen peroxide-inducible genes activator [Hydrogenophilus sp.]
MTLTELRYLLALAEVRHFGKAAERCGVSQPTLSLAIKKLERHLGVILFERTSGEARLTEAGRALAEQAARVVVEVQRLEELAQSFRDPLQGPLRVGAIYTIGPYLFPRLVPLMRRRAPSMPLILEEDFTTNLAERLKRGEVDVAILSLPFEEAGVVTQPIYDEPFRVLLPAGHRWLHQERVVAEQLAEEAVLLLGPGNCFRDQVLEICPQCARSSPLQTAFAGSSLETIRLMVASGVGITVLPASAADDTSRLSPLLAVRPFAPPEPYRRVVLAWRVTYPRHQAVDLLRQTIYEAGLPGIVPVGGVAEGYRTTQGECWERSQGGRAVG